MELLGKEVLFIDLDGTLIKTISEGTFPDDISDFRIQLPVLSKIAKAFPKLEYMFIVTNQGGAGIHFDAAEMEAKIQSISVFCKRYLMHHMPTFITANHQVCFALDKSNPLRKPNTGMLENCVPIHSVEDKSKMIMIGDASGKEGDHSDSDKKCAENFGIDYLDVRDFLNLRINQ